MYSKKAVPLTITSVIFIEIRHFRKAIREAESERKMSAVTRASSVKGSASLWLGLSSSFSPSLMSSSPFPSTFIFFGSVAAKSSHRLVAPNLTCTESIQIVLKVSPDSQTPRIPLLSSSILRQTQSNDHRRCPVL